MGRSQLYRKTEDGNYDYIEIDHNNDDKETVLQVLTATEYEKLMAPDPDQAAIDQRIDRDFLLEETDWWCVSDRTPTEAQLNYRQALRDLPTHSNWPFLEASDWPTKPS